MQAREQELEKAASEALAASTAAAEEHAAEEERLAKLRHELGSLQEKVREQCLLLMFPPHCQGCADSLMQQQTHNATWVSTYLAALCPCRYTVPCGVLIVVHIAVTHLHDCPAVQARSDVEACERRAQELAAKEAQLSELAANQAAVSIELDTGDSQLPHAAALTFLGLFKSSPWPMHYLHLPKVL